LLYGFLWVRAFAQKGLSGGWKGEEMRSKNKLCGVGEAKKKK